MPAPCARTSAFRSARLADAVTAGLCSAAHVQMIARVRLSIHYEDAGVAYLLNKEANYAAISVFAHHRGLPDF